MIFHQGVESPPLNPGEELLVELAKLIVTTGLYGGATEDFLEVHKHDPELIDALDNIRRWLGRKPRQKKRKKHRPVISNPLLLQRV